VNRIYVSLIDAQLRAFVADYSDTARNVFYDPEKRRLLHPGEFGGFRESLVRDLLARFLPESYGVSQGFVISPEGDVSSQCDIIIYSRQHAPVIHSAEQQRFFPVESVVAVGEVKSTLANAALKDACLKLHKVKEMRAKLRAPAIAFSALSNIGPYSAHEHLLDQLATFIVAAQVEGDASDIERAVDEGGEAPSSYRVNVILDVHGWCSAYRDLKGLLWPYPVDVDAAQQVVPNRLPLVLFEPGADHLEHLRVFLHFMQLLVTRTTVLHPDLNGYWGKS
jgi:hypothetical protein